MVDLIKIFLKWKWPIVGLTMVAGVIAALISISMPNYYKSTVTFYPLNLTLLEPSMIFELNAGEQNIGTYGGKTDANRIITLARSGPIVDYIINEYKLAEHYGIDTSSKTWRYKTQRQFLGNYKVLKTGEEALKISIYDKDPKMSSTLANAIVDMIDKHNAKSVIGNKDNVLKSLKNKATLLEKDILDLSVQMNRMNNRSSLEYQALQQRHSGMIEQLNQYIELADKYDITSSISIETIDVMEKAYPSVKKAKPKRSLIVISVAMLCFMLLLIVAVILEKYKEARSELANA